MLVILSDLLKFGLLTAYVSAVIFFTWILCVLAVFKFDDFWQFVKFRCDDDDVLDNEVKDGNA